MASTTAQGSAGRWGPLWGARPGDWAASEEQQLPTYEAVLARIALEPGQPVLDVGCGTGVFLRAAADRGARAFGLDASERLLEIARERVPDADLRTGDMELLPYEDDSFDLVTGFNSFFFATDMVAAVSEAGRVAKPGADVVLQVWGPHERCDLEAMKAVIRPFMPPRPPGSPPDPELWRPGTVESIATQAGLTPKDAFDVSYAFEYPDPDTLGRRMMAPAGIAELVGPEREDAVRAEIVEALAPYRGPDGVYRLENEFRVVIASA